MEATSPPAAGGERRRPRGQEWAVQDMGGQALSVVVEFQKVELDRLLKDNRRLNERLDHLGEEARHFREMQQREQILRQQEQKLREQAQAILDRLTQRLALPGPQAAAGIAASGHPGADSSLAPTPLEPAGSRAWATAGPRPSRSGPDRPVSQDAATSTATPVIPPVEEPPPGLAPEAAKPGADDAAELAEILEDLGRSLRDLGDAPPTPVTPLAVAEGPGDSAVPAGARPVPPPREQIPPAPGAPPPLPEISDDEQAALADILGRMGPSAGDRRSAARIMRRLFRNRNTPRDRSR